MKTRLRSALIMLALAAALLGALVLAFRPRAILVETAVAERGRFVAVVEEDGRTRVRQRYLVSAPVAGRVLRVSVRPGDAVARDAPVAVMLAAPSALRGMRGILEAEERVGAAEAMLEQADAMLHRAAAESTQAEAEAIRARSLAARGAIPAQQLERAELGARSAARNLEAAERRRHAAEHELAQTRAALVRAEDELEKESERLVLRAPVAGRVLRVPQESEAVVPAGAPLIEIADPAELEVAVDLLTTEAVSVTPGARATIERWGGPGALEARVRRVEPGAFTKVSALGVEEQRVWVLLDITSPREQWATLGDGFRVEARIVTEALDDVLLIPAGALFRRGDGWAVFVVEEGVARERRLEVARRAARHAVAASGVSAGETVVLFPPSALRDGARIRQTPSR